MASIKAFSSSDNPRGRAFASQFSNATEPVPIQRFNANWDIDPSFELYFKGYWKDAGLKAQVTRFNNHNFDNSQLTEAEFNRDWVELTWSPRVNDSTRLASRMYYNNYRLNYDHTVDNYDNDFNMQGGGVEAILYHEGDDYNLTGGVIAEVHELEFLSAQDSVNGAQYEIAPTTLDTQLALFGEGTYRGIKDWQFTLGGRVQYNHGILENTIFLPQAAAIYSITDNWTAKYVYNVSEVAPTLNLWRGG